MKLHLPKNVMIDHGQLIKSIKVLLRPAHGSICF